MKELTYDLLNRLARLEKQGDVSKDTSLKVRRLIRRHSRAIARQDSEVARNLVAEICTILLEEGRR